MGVPTVPVRDVPGTQQVDALDCGVPPVPRNLGLRSTGLRSTGPRCSVLCSTALGGLGRHTSCLPDASVRFQTSNAVRAPDVANPLLSAGQPARPVGARAVLSYVVGTPASYGFAGRNGRPLADNAPEAMLSLVLDSAVPSGLTPAVASQLRMQGFPYVVAA